MKPIDWKQKLETWTPFAKELISIGSCNQNVNVVCPVHMDCVTHMGFSGLFCCIGKSVKCALLILIVGGC
jgi:hypothetical protein